jgi:hypothetical protein
MKAETNPEHYKKCSAPGRKRTLLRGGRVICPGCNRLCRFPMGIEPGAEVLVLKEGK